MILVFITNSWNNLLEEIQVQSSTNTIDFITIATTGNATDFGDLTNQDSNAVAGVLLIMQQEGLMAGGMTPTTDNTIDYVTMQRQEMQLFLVIYHQEMDIGYACILQQE